MRASELSGTRLVRTRTVTSHSNRTPSDQILYAFAKPVIESSEVGSMLKAWRHEVVNNHHRLPFEVPACDVITVFARSEWGLVDWMDGRLHIDPCFVCCN